MGGSIRPSTFDDRRSAGKELARHLAGYRGDDAIVVGLPRGGVPVAAEVASALDLPLDVIVVRKLGVPTQPELAMGAIGEGGVLVVDPLLAREVGVSDEVLRGVERRERRELDRRVDRFRGGRPPQELRDRTVIVVDDGIATGSTARAACQVVRAAGARRVVLATPVAPHDWTERLARVADDLVAVHTPVGFGAVGRFYRDFSQVSDDEVVEILARVASASGGTSSAHDRAGSHTAGAGSPHTRTDLAVPTSDGRILEGILDIPADPLGVVVFAHGSGSSRRSVRNRLVADALNEAGLATLLFDLLTDTEASDRRKVFDIDLLADRLASAVEAVRSNSATASVPLGLFGASTGAAAALTAAADPSLGTVAVVSRGGRPDLAGAALAAVEAPTLLIVGGADTAVLQLNEHAREQMSCPTRVAVVPGAGHLFAEDGALAQVARLAAAWFSTHFVGPADVSA